MHATRIERWTAGRPGTLLLLAVLTLGALLAVTLGACGNDGGGEGTGTDETSLTGSYDFESGTEEGMEGFTLTINDDETFTLSQIDPESGEEVGIGGTYTLDGSTITLVNDDGSESEAGTVDGERLVFETITWVRR